LTRAKQAKMEARKNKTSGEILAGLNMARSAKIEAIGFF